MESTKESDLVTAVLLYAMRCLAEGDHVALHNMKFGPREIEALRDGSGVDYGLLREAMDPTAGTAAERFCGEDSMFDRDPYLERVGAARRCQRQ